MIIGDKYTLQANENMQLKHDDDIHVVHVYSDITGVGSMFLCSLCFLNIIIIVVFNTTYLNVSKLIVLFDD